MANIFLHDVRVAGQTPRCDLPFRVNAGDPLTTMLTTFAGQVRSRFPTRGHTLQIMCHGSAQGLLLGTPNLTKFNVAALFPPLQGLFSSIIMRACAAAAIYVQGAPPLYHGAIFCSLLARTVRASVMASDAIQFYLPSASITNASNRNQLATWRGNVGTWDATGRLTGFTTEEQRAMGY
jgi:hypothetical protein